MRNIMLEYARNELSAEEAYIAICAAIEATSDPAQLKELIPARTTLARKLADKLLELEGYR